MVLSRNILKTNGNHVSHVEQKRKETHVLRGSQWKTQGTHRFCVGTYENKRQTFVLRGDELNTQGKHMFSEFFF